MHRHEQRERRRETDIHSQDAQTSQQRPHGALASNFQQAPI